MNNVFPVKLEKSGTDFIASFPDVLGANARGPRKAIALIGAAEALNLVLAEMMEDGLAYPVASRIEDGEAAVVAQIVWRNK